MRRSPRFEVHYPAHVAVDDSSPLLRCIVSDISADGARLTVGTRGEVPDEVTLLFRRRCRVVHRAGGQIGVEFV